MSETGATILFVVPHRPHRDRVLADRNRDPERRRELGADGADGVVERGVLARMAGGGHPVGGEPHVGQFRDARRGDVGDRLADREARGGGGVEHRDRRALAHGHRLAGVALEGAGRDRHVGDGHLPGADHLIARDETADGAIADRDEEGLVGDRGEAEHAVRRLARVERARIERLARRRDVLRVASHAPKRADARARRAGLAEDDVERHVDRSAAEVRVGDDELSVAGRVAEHREGAALARADCTEFLERRSLGDAEHVALLRFVAPELERRHARLAARDRAELEARAAPALVHELGERVRETAGPDVVDRGDRVLVAERPARVDDLLAAALHLGVVALDRGEIEVLVRRALRDRRSGAAAEPDEERGAAEHDERRALGDLALLHVPGAHVAEPAGDHDRFVEAAILVLEGAKEARDGRPPELVVERGGAERALGHDRERGRDALGPADGLLPRLLEPGEAQVGYSESHQARLGLAAAAGRAFVADLAARAGRRARVRRDRRRVVVRLDLHEDVNRLDVRAVHAVAVGEEPRRLEALDHGRVVAVGREHAGRARLGRPADHAKERVGLRRAVDRELGVEDFVTTVLAVRLREHHELDVGRVATERRERALEVLDLVRREREPHLRVRGLERGAVAADRRHRPRILLLEELLDLADVDQDRLGHAIVDRGAEGLLVVDLAEHGPRDAALDAPHALEAARAADVGGLGRPRRDRAEARHDEAAAGLERLLVVAAAGARPVREQRVELAALVARERLFEIDDVEELRVERPDPRAASAHGLAHLREPRRRERVGTEEREDHGEAPCTTARAARAHGRTLPLVSAP